MKEELMTPEGVDIEDVHKKWRESGEKDEGFIWDCKKFADLLIEKHGNLVRDNTIFQVLVGSGERKENFSNIDLDGDDSMIKFINSSAEERREIIKNLEEEVKILEKERKDLDDK